MRFSQPRPHNARPPGSPSAISRGHFYLRLAAVFVLVLLIGVAGGMLIERNLVQRPGDAATFRDLEAVVDVIDSNYYYRPTDEGESHALEKRMEQQAITGLLSSLDDEYTRYLSADQSQTAAEDLQGHYGGPGIDIAVEGGRAIVANVIPGTPAEEAGILRGDVIEKVDNLLVDVNDFDGLIRRLRGEVGSRIRLSMLRPSTGQPYEADMIREEIVVPPVTFRMIPDTTIGWIQVTIFGDQTTAGVDKAIADAESRGATGLVLDLRGRHPAAAVAAQEVLARFLDPDVGPAMYEDITPGRGGEEPLPILGDGATKTDLPLVVLVDRGTASASEIVAGALKDYNRALVIGERTYGKGSVQRIFSFSDGSTLRVTVAEWFTPSKGRIQEEGIRPDLEVSFADHATTGEDPVLAAAVTMLDSGRSRPTDLANPPATPATPVATP
ncbi:MAG TPA: S41 family peptidase [Thermomicrobiales bacterium]|nr:S41 family peptidase [Thermomicrobiales bacterium]